MSRLHGRYPRDWTLDVVRDGFSGWSRWPTDPPRYLLSMTLDSAEMNQLLQVISERHDAYRGYPLFSYVRPAGDYVRVTGIEVTEAEARRMTRGDDPFEVLLGEFPPCGYRLYAAADPLTAGG